LVIAEAANPEWVSVPLVGWSLANALREVADVHLVTQIRNRDAILRKGWREGVDFTPIDSEALARPMARAAQLMGKRNGKGWSIGGALNSITYPYFEHLVWKKFGPHIQSRQIDIVHRVTPLTPTLPSPLARRCKAAGVPFVIGPLNGGVPWPKAFGDVRRKEAEWLAPVRSAYKLLPGYRATLRCAGAIIAGSEHVESTMPDTYREKLFYIPENAVDPERFGEVAHQTGRTPVGVVFVGRLVPYKGPDMLIEAAAGLLRSGDMTLDIAGDGPLRQELEAQVEAAGLVGKVRFLGMLPHAEIQGVLSRSQVFAFPSIREFGGGVVIEAMATGLVPIVVDYGGPGELVTEATGFRLPLRGREEIVAALSGRLASIVADPSVLPGLAAAARTRAMTYFTWYAKARQIAQIYDWVLGSTPFPPIPIPRESRPHDA
jgi:glycosyltransferase involved in cell wall biosynthesis